LARLSYADSTELRNSRVRTSEGAEKIYCGAPCSTMRPGDFWQPFNDLESNRAPSGDGMAINLDRI
jgi:hypothetical protein